MVEECTALAGPAPAIPAGLTPNVLRKTNPGELMRLVKDAYRLMGYDVVNMNAGRGLDTGIDLLVQGQGEIFLFVFWQDGSVDVPLEKVREVLGIAVGEGATRGIVVSPGGFSRAAVKFAHQKGNGRLELMDVRVLQKLLDSAAASPAQTTPACPCCGGRMEVSGKVRVKGRRTLAWHCLSAPACAGTVAMGHHNTGVIVR